jgi:hypothetical protein
MDVVALNDEDAMNIDEDESRINNMVGTMSCGILY